MCFIATEGQAVLEVGGFNQLEVLRSVEFGVYLDAGEVEGKETSLLLPKRYVPDDCEIGDWIDVFVYFDSEDRLIATTEKPFVTVGQCAYLKVVDVNRAGAFVNWGLSRDLLVPFNEQNDRMVVGKFYVVAVYLDDLSGRIVASERLHRHLSESDEGLNAGEQVELMICGKSDMGYKAVVNDTQLGLVYSNEVFQPLRLGQRLSGYIKPLREDGKIDLSLQQPAVKTRDGLMKKILDNLAASDGVSTLTDKSRPEDIYKQYQVSKSNYKKALGRLYKQGLVTLSREKVVLKN